MPGSWQMMPSTPQAQHKSEGDIEGEGQDQK